MPSVSTTVLLAVVTIIVLNALPESSAFPFRDVSDASGLTHALGRRKKYGGPSVADLDGDGYPDLLLGHHDDGKTELFFNNRDGTFVQNRWRVLYDTHALSAIRTSPRQRYMHFVLSQGGNFGRRPTAPVYFSVSQKRVVRKDLTQPFVNATGRGRSTVAIGLRLANRGVPDLVILNARLPAHTLTPQKAFKTKRSGRLSQRRLRGFETSTNTYGMATDVDNDGVMELVSFQILCVHKLVEDFHLKDISDRVLPPEIMRMATVAVAELDFDNDGLWDLYIARTTTGDLSWQRRHRRDDYLLRNVGGRYVDVSAKAGLPSNTQTRGVTVGDFDNDGWVDILLTRYEGNDLILFNNGDGSFRQTDAGFARHENVRGDMGTAVDLDRDGRLDVVLSEGDWLDKERGGFFRLMKNVGVFGNFLHVRVGSSDNSRSTSLHAVVRVSVPGQAFMRRVGSPGTAVSNSYVEVLHFGLGHSQFVLSVSVTWTDGSVASRQSIASGAFVTFGQV